MSLLKLIAPCMLAVSMLTAPLSAGSALAQGKSMHAPGQMKKLHGGHARDYAPGQLRNRGQSARWHAPGQQALGERERRQETVRRYDRFGSSESRQHERTAEWHRDEDGRWYRERDDSWYRDRDYSWLRDREWDWDRRWSR